MRIYKNLIWNLTWIVVLFHLGILESIIPLPFKNNLWAIQLITLLFVSVYTILSMIQNGSINDYFTTNIYVITYVLCLVGIMVYTVTNGITPFNTTILCSTNYWSILLIYPLIYCNNRFYENGELLESVCRFCTFTTVVKGINCLVFDNTGIAIFPNLIAVQIRDGHSTTSSGAIANIVLILSFYYFLHYSDCDKRKSRRYFLYTIWGLVFAIRFVGSRMMIVSLVAALIVTWYTKQRGMSAQFLTFIGAIVLISIFLQTPFAENLMETITSATSNDASNGIYTNTMSTRLATIESAQSVLQGRPIGFIPYGTESFRKIFQFGSNDDLGYLGTWLTFGWYCVPIIVLLIFRYIMMIMKYHDKEDINFIWGVLVYLCVTGISLSFMDRQRIDVIPYLVLIIEIWEKRMLE